MLPAWATVVLSLVSALAGVAGGIVITWMRIGFDRTQATEAHEHERQRQETQLAHEREAEWRERLVFAAVDFSIGVEHAILGVREVISAVRDKRELEPFVVEAKRVLHEAVARVARIKLLFGDGSDSTRLAKDLLPELDLARGAASNPDPTFAWEKLAEVYRLHEQFNTAAFEMISNQRWRVGRNLTMRYRVEGPHQGD
jgi:hypothetical protein